MYKAPSLDNLSRQVRQAFKSQVPGSDPWVWPNTFFILGKVLAGLFRGLYQHLEFIHRQALVTTSADEYLDLHGADLGLARKQASVATGACTFVTDLINTLPAGTRLVRSDGQVFITDYKVVPTQNPSTVAVRALETGVKGNTEAAAVIELETPIAGIGSFTVDDAGITGGADAETDTSYRARLLDRKRNPPSGGTPSEYIEWCRQVAGVTRVFVQRATPAAGSVTIVVMVDDSIYVNGIPSAADIARVEAYLETVAPANANIVVVAPTPVVVDVTIGDLTPNTAAVKEAVKRELKAMFRRRSAPGTPSDDFIFSKSWIDEAISIATGETSHTLSAPATDTTCGDSEVAVLGTVTFT